MIKAMVVLNHVARNMVMNYKILVISTMKIYKKFGIVKDLEFSKSS